MDSKIKIRILDNDHYIIRSFYNKNVNVYNIEYCNDGNIYTIDYKDIDKINCNYEIVSYRGLRGLLTKLFVHKHFILASILSVITIVLLSNVIWELDVIHNDKHIREIVEGALNEKGINRLTFKKSFDQIQDIKKYILDTYPNDIEWLEIIDDGMKYTVRVEERIINTPIKKSDYCDIISTKDAVILSSRISSGQLLVDQGDRVKKESILVSGAIRFNEEIKDYTCSEGTIYGNTWYTINVSMPYDYVYKKYTGKTKRNISFGSGNITPIFKVHMKNYDVDRKKIFNFGNVVIYREMYKEYITINDRYNDEEVEKKALEIARDKLLTNLDSSASILDEKVLQTRRYDSIIEMDIFYSVKEVISKTIVREKVSRE